MFYVKYYEHYDFAQLNVLRRWHLGELSQNLVKNRRKCVKTICIGRHLYGKVYELFYNSIYFISFTVLLYLWSLYYFLWSIYYFYDHINIFYDQNIIFDLNFNKFLVDFYLIQRLFLLFLLRIYLKKCWKILTHKINCCTARAWKSYEVLKTKLFSVFSILK